MENTPLSLPESPNTTMVGWSDDIVRYTEKLHSQTMV